MFDLMARFKKAGRYYKTGNEQKGNNKVFRTTDHGFELSSILSTTLFLNEHP